MTVKPLNSIKTWQQGRFAPEGRHTFSAEDVRLYDADESILVRPSLRGNAICRCPQPEDAVWIANRLNLAATLEQMVLDFCSGKTDDREMKQFVRQME